MAVAQGIEKTIAYKKQSGIGAAASGSGGQLIRRENASFNLTKDAYQNNEIVDHQQHTGDTHGVRSSAATINGLLSPLSYQDFIGSLLRKAWAATANITGLSVTIAASGSGYTITDGTATFLTDGIKIGDVVQLSGGSLDAANVSKNLLVTAVTETVVTVLVVNESTMTAEGPIASVTMSVPGKKVYVPSTGHLNEYYTFEENFEDITRYHLFQDMQIGSMDVSIPATGNVTCSFGVVGLGYRVKSGTQTLTSPTAATTTSVVSSVAGAVLVNGVRYATITAGNVSIDGQIGAGEAVVGSNNRPDNQRGRIRVSGTISALYEDDVLGTPFDDETSVNLVLVLADDRTAGADFVTLSMSKVKLFSDDADDGEKQIIRAYNFVAEYNGSGGAALANDQTIITVQDSQAA